MNISNVSTGRVADCHHLSVCALQFVTSPDFNLLEGDWCLSPLFWVFFLFDIYLASFIPMNCILVLFLTEHSVNCTLQGMCIYFIYCCSCSWSEHSWYCLGRQLLFWKRWVEFFWIKMRCEEAPGRCGKGKIYIKEVVTSCIWLSLSVTMVCRKLRRGRAVLKIRSSVC